MPSWPRLLNPNPSSSTNASSQAVRNIRSVHDSDSDSSDDATQLSTSLPPAHRYAATSTHHGGDGIPMLDPPPSIMMSQQRSHARSMSDKLPALFGVARRKTPTQNDAMSTPPSLPHDKVSPRRHANATEEPELKIGNCATCDGKVRWPALTTEYRCPTCLMINDLKIQPPPQKFGPLSTPVRARTVPGTASNAPPMPVTVERTNSIIERCIFAYISHIHSNSTSTSASVTTPPQSPPLNHLSAAVDIGPQGLPSLNGSKGHSASLSDESLVSLMQAQLSTSPQSVTNANSTPSSMRRDQRDGTGSLIHRKPLPLPKMALPARPTRKPPPPPLATNSSPRLTSTELSDIKLADRLESKTQANIGQNSISSIPPKAIFKPLEDYIVKSFGNAECLNISFNRSRPRPGRSAHSEDDLRPANVVATPSRSADFKIDISALDAKTLLVGDIAENGQWWAGGEDRAKSMGRAARSGPDDQMVHPKTPFIDWNDVYRWYALVEQAGNGWLSRLHSRSLEPSSPNPSDLDAATRDAIELAFAEARSHVVRTLLKTSEQILKRPGRPLTAPDDLRFLLIVLANPLLYPSAIATTLLRQSSAGHGPGDARKYNDSRAIVSAWDQGHAYGIIKRVLGLLANLNHKCQRYLTNWFSRYDEEHFRRIINLVQGFVTYRLRRQHGRKRSSSRNIADDLIPHLSGPAEGASAQLHAAIGLASQNKSTSEQRHQGAYSEDWQVRAAARMMGMLFAANKNFRGERTAQSLEMESERSRRGSVSRDYIKNHGQLLSTSDFYNTMVDIQDLIGDFELWESSSTTFAFCQYPFFLSVGSKIRIMDYDARRQMEIKAREAFFHNILRNKGLEQYLNLKIRRECLVEDSLRGIREGLAQGSEEVKKGLRIRFVDEEGIDAGGLRKEWFLLLIREIFDPHHGLFVYDEESRLCYFNPNTFEPSDQYFLVGALMGLAIYNSTMLDVAFPPFLFKKLLASGAGHNVRASAVHSGPVRYTLDDLAEFRPSLARGLRQLLQFEGDVESTFCRDFTIEVERYGKRETVQLIDDDSHRPVTNTNRQKFVDLYVHYLLDKEVARQFDPFKRGFFMVCGGNALSLFQPEEIELLVRGSDEALDVLSLKAVAVYENWQQLDPKHTIDEPVEDIPLVQWFWELFEQAEPVDQRKLLGFITSSDRIPAVGATKIIIKISYGGPDAARFPIARTCFNQILLYKYRTRDELRQKVWTAVRESEGFGLK